MSKFVDRTGEVNIANNGQKMTIIDYKNSNDITIKFEDNTIVYHKSIIAFNARYIKNPNFQLPYQINNVIVESKAYIYIKILLIFIVGVVNVIIKTYSP